MCEYLYGVFPLTHFGAGFHWNGSFSFKICIFKTIFLEAKINKEQMTSEHSNLQFYFFQLVREGIIDRENCNETQGIKNYKAFITGSI